MGMMEMIIVSSYNRRGGRDCDGIRVVVVVLWWWWGDEGGTGVLMAAAVSLWWTDVSCNDGGGVACNSYGSCGGTNNDGGDEVLVWALVVAVGLVEAD